MARAGGLAPDRAMNLSSLTFILARTSVTLRILTSCVKNLLMTRIIGAIKTGLGGRS